MASSVAKRSRASAGVASASSSSMPVSSWCNAAFRTSASGVAARPVSVVMLGLCPARGPACRSAFIAGMAGARNRALPAVAGLAVGAGLVAWLVAVHLGAAPSQRLGDLELYRDAGGWVRGARDFYTHPAPPPQRLPFTYPPLAAVLAVPL